MNETLAIAGSGAIASGLAATAVQHGHYVHLLARSQDSAARALSNVERQVERMEEDVSIDQVQIVTETDALTDASFVVEAVVENVEAKSSLLSELSERLGPDAILATTTSSLSVEQLAQASGRADRFVGLHVFNPVTRMKLVELVFPAAAGEQTRARARALCDHLGKTAVEVPDVPGFVVNRLLFPYLFSAVRLQDETGMAAKDIDTCMQLGAGHPMGPLALLDLVGLDVSVAIGEEIGADIPARVRELVAEGALGRKSKRGFYDYSK